MITIKSRQGYKMSLLMWIWPEVPRQPEDFWSCRYPSRSKSDCLEWPPPDDKKKQEVLVSSTIFKLPMQISSMRNGVKETINEVGNRKPLNVIDYDGRSMIRCQEFFVFKRMTSCWKQIRCLRLVLTRFWQILLKQRRSQTCVVQGNNQVSLSVERSIQA